MGLQRERAFLFLILLSFMTVLLEEVFARQKVEKTITFVPACPRNATEWFIAAENKNCSKLSEDFTEELVYHCVPNHFNNITLEVCAPVKYIVFGHCVEYSFFGNTIQANYDTDCQTCPIYYTSNEVYKYEECYHRTSISTTLSPLTSSAKGRNQNTKENITLPEIEQEITLPEIEQEITLPEIEQEKEGAGEEINKVPWIVASISIIIIITCLILFKRFWPRRERFRRNIQDHYTY
ncbi:uncharacterized protein LOC134280946 [Saccostrea cucullata]|uniref:uncharacterized protein LOC134280946 n=1 Tax=Saccostrea cuccullata TaxID=36930 RepID=UPI002ED1DE45